MTTTQLQSVEDARQRQPVDMERIIENLFVYLAGSLLFTILVWKLTTFSVLGGLGIGFYSWAIVYFAFFWKYFWIITKPNYDVVIQDYAQFGNKQKTNHQITDPAQIPDKQRGCGQMIIAVRVTEKIVEKPVHMVKGEHIGETEFEVLDRDNVPLLIDWQAYPTPIPGKWLPRYFQVPQEAADKVFTALFRARLIVLCRQFPGDFILDRLDIFNKLFEATCGGPRRIDPIEIEQGRFTNSPLINKITRKALAEGAKQMKTLAQSQAEAIGLLTAVGVHADRAAIMVMNMSGTSPVDLQVLDVNGLQGVPGGLHINTGRGGGRNRN